MVMVGERLQTLDEPVDGPVGVGVGDQRHQPAVIRQLDGFLVPLLNVVAELATVLLGAGAASFRVDWFDLGMSCAARRNVELKARDHDPGASVRACVQLGACDHGTIWQRDTYFDVPSGGLKLREEQPGGAHLIQFCRPEQCEQRESRYRIAEVMDAGAVVAVLADAIGVWGTVVKRRHVLLWDTVRIHLDDVQGLGRFIELEAVAPEASDLSREYALIAQLRGVLGITDDRLEARGYGRQLLPVAHTATQQSRLRRQ